MRTLAFLEPKEIEEIAWKSLTDSGLPRPRGLEIHEQIDNEGEDIILIGLLVTDSDDLGTAEQRVRARGQIQTKVWESGDRRSAIMRHVLIANSQSIPKTVAV
jgi:hypothetical protein